MAGGPHGVCGSGSHGGQGCNGGQGGGPDAVTWRLVGSNNHELGRSPSVFRALGACGAAVERLRERIGEAVPIVAMSTATASAARAGAGAGTAAGTATGPRGVGGAVQGGPGALSGSGVGAWTWQLLLDEQCVAVAVRTFRRQRECRHSLQLFLSAAAEAQVASGVTHTRRLRGLRLPGAGDAPGLALRGGGPR
ncbi:hypothetical protein OG730_35250 [Streptomyces sp. NBC_01298]|uniref:hypothetical protein n=1 Tax=Streptomyces sp. NBC_01298 TaxID=2903817 RepID=UPI002E14999F|nr:hypothetical protein OG730_35250 [Streptomyces sp. NBC_01298]